MTTRQATVQNGHGIHCRPSAEIAKNAQTFAADITVRSDSSEADAKQILPLISLGLTQGAVVTVETEGPDEQKACERIVELVETKFDFPPRDG